MVWMPILAKDDEAAAGRALSLVADRRALHFWNPDKEVARQATRALHAEKQMEEAWDVFLIYGPDVRWVGPELPAPTAWMHHLAEKDPRWMTPEALSRVLNALLPDRAR